MVNVVVIMFQGNIEEVKVVWRNEGAYQFFQEKTGVAWAEFSRRCENQDSETILGNYAGSNIWETELERG